MRKLKNKMVFTIKGKYKNGYVEDIDTAETKEQANYLLNEYKMAFGNDYRLWIE